MTDELKPCPFCGSDELSHGWSAPGYDGSFSTGNVECHNCDVLIYARGGEAEAIAAWNMRVASQPLIPSLVDDSRQVVGDNQTVTLDRAVVEEVSAALERIATVDMGGGFLGAQSCRIIAAVPLAKLMEALG